MANLSPLPEAWKKHDLSVKPYLWSHRRIAWTQNVLGLALLVWFFYSGMARDMQTYYVEFGLQGYVLWLAYFATIGGVWEIITFPFGVGHHGVEKRFGLSRQSFGSWFADKLKGWALGAVLGSIALGLVYLAVRWFPAYWWFACATLLLLFSVVLAQLAPVLLIPLFLKMRPMEMGPLKQRLLALCERFQIRVKEVYHLGLGEKTEKGNAAFMGLGATKRIVIGDTIYEKYTTEEVEAVFAHELGHQVHNDLWKGIALSTVLLYASFAIANGFAEPYLFAPYSTSALQPFGLLGFFLVLSIIQIPMGVFQVLFSRNREWAADEFASKTIGVSAPLADALEKLTYQNRGQFKPNAIVEWFTYSHPAPARRILKLRGTR